MVKRALRKSRRWVMYKLPTGSFEYGGQRYRYFSHPYNDARENERTVEVPIFERVLRGVDQDRVLEVGNVLSHYGHGGHDVIDKYEQAPGVHNVDVVSHRPDKKYELIVSISTLEHAGWDEDEKEPDKIPAAIANLRSLLTPDGRLVVSLPLGYNGDLDRLLNADALPFSERRCLRRVSRGNRWREVGWDEIKDAAYGHPYPSANAMAILTFESA